MGHTVNMDREYHLLQQRLDRDVTGAPDSPIFMEILKLLFTPDEAEIVRHIPTTFTSLNVLSRKLKIPREKLNEKMSEMARKGLVMDIEYRKERYFRFSPVVIGFFEFTFMRTRDELPMPELARLFDEYMNEDDRFAHSIFQGETQIGRTLVHEESLPEGDHAEILDWEKTSKIIHSATAIGVSLCSCRHKATLLGEACDNPLESCITFNYAADMLIRNGLARRITVDEAMELIKECKEAGLVQIGDNVKRKVRYICNCCSCCCEQIHAIKTFEIRNAVVTSNWICGVDLDNCRGCGRCSKVCPVDAIEILQDVEGENKKKWAVCDETLCLGCGVCYLACKFGGILMKPRVQRVFIPETYFDQIVVMAIERGKLANLLFEDPDRLSHRALRRIVNILEKTPPFKAAMAIKPLKSVFLSTVVRAAKMRSGEKGEVVG